MYADDDMDIKGMLDAITAAELADKKELEKLEASRKRLIGNALNDNPTLNELNQKIGNLERSINRKRGKKRHVSRIAKISKMAAMPDEQLNDKEYVMATLKIKSTAYKSHKRWVKELRSEIGNATWQEYLKKLMNDEFHDKIEKRLSGVAMHSQDGSYKSRADEYMKDIHTFLYSIGWVMQGTIGMQPMFIRVDATKNKQEEPCDVTGRYEYLKVEMSNSIPSHVPISDVLSGDYDSLPYIKRSDSNKNTAEVARTGEEYIATSRHCEIGSKTPYLDDKNVFNNEKSPEHSKELTTSRENDIEHIDRLRETLCEYFKHRDRDMVAKLCAMSPRGLLNVAGICGIAV